MELPPFHDLHHHHNRYVPSLPPPSFPDERHRNFYRPQLLHRPPLPPPVAQPPTFRTHSIAPPPPPPHNPHDSQFTFLNHHKQVHHHHRPIEDDSPRPFLLDLNYQLTPRKVSGRTLFQDARPRLRMPEFDNPHRPDARPDPWAADPARVPPEHQPLRPALFDFNQQPPHHQRQFNIHDPVSSYRPIDKYEHDMELDSRFQDEFIDGLFRDSRGGDDDNGNFHRGHNVYESSFGRTRRNLVFGVDSHNISDSNSIYSRDLILNSNLGNYESSHDLVPNSERPWNNRDEDRIWGHSDSLLGVENTEYEVGDAVSNIVLRREANIYESGRFNGKERDNMQDFVHTPKKKIQRKSALLRIQLGKSSNRSRNTDQHFSKTYFDESRSGAFRGKDSFVYINPGIEEERDGSPVELDVSFKSNGLVAKAIMGPSSPVADSDRNITPRNSKIRKVSVSDSPLTSVHEGSVEFDSSIHGSDCPSSSKKAPEQLSEKVTVFDNPHPCDSGSHLCSNGTTDFAGDNAVKGSSKGSVPDMGGTNGSSDGTPLLRVRKKKRVKTLSRKSNSEMMKQNSEASSTNNISVASRTDEGAVHVTEKITPAVVSCGVVSLSSPCKAGDNTMVKLPQAIDSEKDDNDTGSGGTWVANTKRKRNSLSPVLDSSGPLENKVDVSIGNAHTSTQGGSLIESQIENTTPSIGKIDDINHSSCEIEIPSLNENSPVNGSAEPMVSDGYVDTGFSSPGKIRSDDDHVDANISVNAACDVSNSGHGAIERQENVIVSDRDTVDVGFEKPFLDQVDMPLESGSAERTLDAVPSVKDDIILGLSKAEETKMHKDSSVADASNHALSTVSISGGDLSYSLGNIANINTCLVDDSGKQSCLGGAAMSLDNGPVEGSPWAMVSVGDSVDATSGMDIIPEMRRKRKFRNPQLDLPSPRTDDTLVNVVSSAHDINKTLCFPDDYLHPPEEELTVSGAGSSAIDSQFLTAVESHLCGNSLNEGFSEVELPITVDFCVGSDATPPKHRKKRKVSEPGLSFTMLSKIDEECVSAETSKPSEVPSNIVKGAAHSEEKNAVSFIGAVYSAVLSPCLNPISAQIENSVAGGSFESDLVEGSFAGDCSKAEKESITPSSGEAEQKEAILVVATTNYHSGIIDMQHSNGGDNAVATYGIQDDGRHSTEPSQHRLTIETQTPVLNQGLPIMDIECEKCQLVEDNLSPSLFAEADGVSTTNSCDELIDSLPDNLSNMGSPEDLCDISGSPMLNSRSSLSQISSGRVCGNDTKLSKNPVSVGSSVPYSLTSSLDHSKISLKSKPAVKRDPSENSKTVSFISEATNKTTYSSNFVKEESNLGKNHLSYTGTRVFPGPSSTNFTTSRKTAPPNHFSKARTWHRTGNSPADPVTGTKCYSSPVPPQRQSPAGVAKFQNSYIRKGNSLVRKPSPVTGITPGNNISSSSVNRLNRGGIDDLKKSNGFESRIDVVNPPSCSKMEGSSASFEDRMSPLLHCRSETLNSSTMDLGDSKSDSLADLPQNDCAATTSNPLELRENVDAPKSSEDDPRFCGTPEYQPGSSNNLEVDSVVNEGNLVKKIVYVKRKSNQLVAASNSGDPSIEGVDKTQVSSSEGYYKRRKNQLIRTSLESHAMQKAAFSDENSNSETHRIPGAISTRSSAKRRSSKGSAKAYKPSKCSLVWTLCDAKSSRKDGNTLRYRKVWPTLFPWKRAAYWKSFLHYSAPISNTSSLSPISRKLLQSRKRDTIYRRSSNGFSLRISKVLSVGGSSLKWSKSIERKSQKANEEATLAVAAADKRKREQNGVDCAVIGTKSRNHSSRDRIFRIGFVRYKMDPTRRTLQRISDEELLCPAAFQSEKDDKRSYVPRRLLIGNDEYVRIGNGNQLIRDPKRRTRILASEKVRWSLHTARLRLAKKRKYCQFFTRFGKCNKDDGKCPYIHDPSKIVVCTKFLNGLCSNPNCKLTHKVIPERMQDCSYFLQGLCSYENCPYRHVNVNPNASVCEGFLRGYCADGNECRKKHTYVCPTFEATGICPQRSKCKLHHPKKQKRGIKKKTLGEQNNTRGRYFGSMQVDKFESRTVVSEKQSAEDIFCLGKFADFISLDISDEETEETNDLASKQRFICDSDDLTESQVADVDELTKPMRIMSKNLMSELSPPIFSPSEKSASYVSEDSNCCNSIKGSSLLIGSPIEKDPIVT